MTEKFEQTKEKKNFKEEKKFKQSKPAEITLIFKANRAFELKIGRKLYRFEGREAKTFPQSILEHKDFTDEIKKYFVIK